MIPNDCQWIGGYNEWKWQQQMKIWKFDNKNQGTKSGKWRGLRTHKMRSNCFNAGVLYKHLLPLPHEQVSRERFSEGTVWFYHLMHSITKWVWVVLIPILRVSTVIGHWRTFHKALWLEILPIVTPMFCIPVFLIHVFVFILQINIQTYKTY